MSGKQSVIRTRREDEVTAFVDQWNGVRNIYYTLNPTIAKLKKKPSKQEIAEVEYLHADLDREREETAKQAKRRYADKLEQCSEPTFVIDSGNGYNVLWRLKQPLPPERFAEVEAINKGLLHALGSTPGTHDVCRILRLPGTINLPTKPKLEKGFKECAASLITAKPKRADSFATFTRFAGGLAGALAHAPKARRRASPTALAPATACAS